MKKTRIIFFVFLTVLVLFLNSCIFSSQGGNDTTYNVTFYGFNHEILEVQNIKHGTSAIEPKDMEVEGFTFLGWDKEFNSITKDTDIFAMYDIKFYDVVWKNYDNTVLATKHIKFGENPLYEGETPTKEKTASIIYTFNGWERVLGTPENEIVYIAIYKEETVKFKVTFNHYDGGAMYDVYVDYGKDALPPINLDLEGFTFIGWDTSFENITKDLIVNPIYEINTYTIKWLNEDSSLIYEEVQPYGYMPEYKGEWLTKDSSSGIVYNFIGWTPFIEKLNGDVSYTAVFKEYIIDYYITWINYDGSELQKSILRYGQTPEYRENTPEKPSTDKYSYIFKGWDSVIEQATINKEYYAVYEEIINRYEVTFIDFYGNVIQSIKVDYGIVPNIPIPKTIEGYTFTQWDNTIGEILFDSTFKMIYSINYYEVSFIDWDGSVIKLDNVAYLSDAIPPDNFSRHNYVFLGWNRDYSSVSENITVKALYERVYPYEYRDYKDGIAITRYLFDDVVFLDVPDTIDGKEVLRIDVYAFGYINTLKEVILPNSIIELDGYIFAGSTSITNLTIPFIGSDRDHLLSGRLDYLFGEYNSKPQELESLIITDAKSIDEYAIQQLNSLAFLDINEGVTSIGKYGISNLQTLANVRFPNSLTYIDNYGFMNNGISSIVFGDESKLVSIGQGSFSGNTRLSKLVLPEGLITIKENSFKNCINLESLFIPDSVTSLGQDVFSGMSNLKELNTPFIGSDRNNTISGLLLYNLGNKPSSLNKLTIRDQVMLGEFGLVDINSLEVINLPHNLSIISRYSISNLPNLKSIIIPNKVSYIGQGAISNNEQLEMVYFEANSELSELSSYIFENNISLSSFILPKGIKTIGDFAFANNYSLINFDFNSNNSLESIGSYAFSNARSLESISIPSNVKSIGKYGFEGNSKLKEFIFEKSSLIREIQEFTFLGCISLNNLYLPNNLEEIRTGAFNDLTRLNYLSIPNSVLRIGREIFSNNTNLNSLALPFIGSDRNYIESSNLSYLFKDELPSSLTSILTTDNDTIGSHAFFGLNNITNIIISNTVKVIEEYAFSSMEGIKSVYIPNNVTEIGSFAFSQSINLEEVIFEENSKILKLGFSSFSNLSKLKSITIPNSVITMGAGVFSFNSNLESITLPFVGESYVDDHTRNNYGFIFDYNVPESLKEINITRSIILHSYSLSNITKDIVLNLPNTLETIEGSAFASSYGLTELIIPNSVKFIGENAFENCYRLNKLVIPFVGSDREYRVSSKAFYTRIPEVDELIITDTTHMVDNMFSNYKNLKNITILSNLLHMEINTFYNSKGLININVDSDNYKSIKGVIYDSSGKTLIKFPEGRKGEYSVSEDVDEIYEKAFYFNTFLTKLYIPDNITSIGKDAFLDTSALLSISLPFIGSDRSHLISSEFSYVFGEWNDKIKLEELIIHDASIIGNNAFQGTEISSIVLNEGVTTIGKYAFENTKKLKSITIPSTVTLIDDYAFANNVEFSNFTIPDNVNNLGNYIFLGSKNIRSLSIPFVGSDREHITSSKLIYLFGPSYEFYPDELTDVSITDAIALGINAFSFANNLACVVISDGVKNIDYTAFNYTPKLKEIIVDSDYYKSLDGILYSGDYKNLVKYPEGIKDGYTFIKGLNEISSYAFFRNHNFTTITIPNFIEYIGSNSFSQMDSLTSISLPFIGSDINHQISSTLEYVLGSNDFLIEIKITNALSIGNYALYNLSNIQNIELNEGITSIEDYAFYGMSSITNIDLPKTLEVIGIYSFSNMINLDSIEFHENLRVIDYNAFENNNRIKKITIPNNVEFIGYSAFFNLHNLEEVIIPFIGSDRLHKVTSRLSDIVSVNNEKLRKVKVTDALTLGENAFKDFIHLEFIEVNDSVTSIGDKAFNNLPRLTIFHLPRKLENLWGEVFNNTSIEMLEFSKDVSYIDEYSMYYNQELNYIHIDELNENYKTIEGVLYDYNLETLIKVPDAKMGEFTIFDSVDNLGIYSFDNTYNLSIINIGSNINEFNPYIFTNNLSLEQINVSSENNSFISDQGVLYTKDLTKLLKFPPNKKGEYTILNGVKEIKNYLFRSANKITRLVIPNSVTKIEAFSFVDLTQLVSISIPFIGFSRDFPREIINDNISSTNLFGYIFGQGYITLKHGSPVPIIENELTYQGQTRVNISISGIIHNRYNAYYIPASLKYITVTDAVGIPTNAFYNLTNIISINLNEDAYSFIGNNAFYGTYLNDVY